MRYIAVDIPHILIILFNLLVCSIQYRQSMKRTSSFDIRSTYLTRIVWHVFIVFIERSYAGTVYNTQGERPKVPHVLHHLIGELTSMAFKHHMTI